MGWGYYTKFPATVAGPTDRPAASLKMRRPPLSNSKFVESRILLEHPVCHTCVSPAFLVGCGDSASYFRARICRNYTTHLVKKRLFSFARQGKGKKVAPLPRAFGTREK